MPVGAQTSSAGLAPFIIEPMFGGRVWGYRDLRPIPASFPEFTIEDLGGLDLIRISPRWPGKPA